MKPSFSPWVPYAAFIVIALGWYAYVERDAPTRISLGAALAKYSMTPNGVVRALRGDQPAVATVVFRDGSTIDAPVAPGCFVQIDDRVFVGDADDSGKRLVFAVRH